MACKLRLTSPSIGRPKAAHLGSLPYDSAPVTSNVIFMSESE